MSYIVVWLFVACYSLSGQTLEWPHDLSAIPAANATSIATIKSLVRSVLEPDGSELMTLGEFRFVPLETVTRIDMRFCRPMGGMLWRWMRSIWMATECISSLQERRQDHTWERQALGFHGMRSTN